MRFKCINKAPKDFKIIINCTFSFNILIPTFRMEMYITYRSINYISIESVQKLNSQINSQNMSTSI